MTSLLLVGHMTSCPTGARLFRNVNLLETSVSGNRAHMQWWRLGAATAQSSTSSPLLGIFSLRPRHVAANFVLQISRKSG